MSNKTTKAAYTLDHVRKTYGTRTVLDIDALTIQQGEIFAIVGPSGAGKSTLLRMLALLEAPSEGQLNLTLNENSITYQTATIEQRRQLSMVFQQPVMLRRSVRANVAYGLRLRGNRNGNERINTALDRVSLLPYAGVRPATLSGGELQRVALARALILEPRVLLLDEPTANLDPANVRMIEDLVREQHGRGDVTIVMVTHNIFQAKRLATRVGFLLNGELVEASPAERFFDAPVDPRTEAFISGEFVY